MINALYLSVRQLDDKPVLRVFLKSISVTLLVFAGIGAGLIFLARWLIGDVFALGSGMADLAAAAAVLLAFLAAWLLFRAVAIGVIGIFADEVVEAVEAKHYPHVLDRARPVALGRSIHMGLGSAGRALLVNLAASPVYMTLFFTGIGTPIAFFIVNSVLLGRDLADMVAARHMDDGAMRDWRRGNRIMRMMLGAAGTALLLVPFVNLVAPVLGAAMATHMFHRRKSDQRTAREPL